MNIIIRNIQLVAVIFILVGTVLAFGFEINEMYKVGRVTLDKKTMHDKDEIMPKYAELIYNGFWFSKSRIKLQKKVDLKRNQVNGNIKLKLYKGNVTILSRQSKSKAYSIDKVSFEENKSFKKSKVERFILGAARKLRV